MTAATIDSLARAARPAVREVPTPVRGIPAPLMREVCDLEIVIPSYNEERRLPATLEAILAELTALHGVSSRIVIVDNGSHDRTAEVVDRIARPDGPQLVVVGCATPGKGAAVRHGLVTSQARVVGFVDADLSVPAATIAPAYARVRDGHDVVIASRRCPGATYEVKQPRFRRIGGWAFRSLVRTLTPGVHDSQCGFKFFTREAARRIFAEMDSIGFAFDVEVLMRAGRLGYRVDELPVAWTDDSASTLGLVSHGPDIARDIVRLHRLDATLQRRARFELVQPITPAPARTQFRSMRITATDRDGTGYLGCDIDDFVASLDTAGASGDVAA